MPYGVQPSGKREQYQLHHVIFFIFTRGMWCDVMSRYMPLCYDIDSKKKKGTQSVGKKWQNQRTMFVWYVVRRIWRRVKLSCFFAFMWGYASSLRLSHTPYTKTKKQMFLKKNGPSLRGGGWGVGWRMLPKSLAALGQRNISPPTCTPCCIPVNIKYKNTTACCVAQ